MSTAPAPGPGGASIDDADRATVLFVDDEPDVLAGLRATLRRYRSRYRFRFAVGAAEAMRVLADEPVDVVISDMRMPGRSGVDLLEQVRADHPLAVRYILSGEAERELVLRAIPVAHRWLSKPCDRDELLASLADAVDHRQLLIDPEAAAAVVGAGSLPTPPALYAELQELLSDPRVSIASVARLIEGDAAISAKLFQWANSAFAAGRPVDEIEGAIVRLGLVTVSQLVLLTGVVDAMGPGDEVPGFTPDLLRRHVGLIGELAAQLAEPPQAVAARMGGLFSVTGLLLEARYLPDRLRAAYQEALTTGTGLVEVERRRHGRAHPELGAHLLALWGLPSELVLTARGAHGRPADGGRGPRSALEAVRLARLLAQQMPTASGIGEPHIDRLDDEMRAAVDVQLETLSPMEGAQP